MFTSRLLILQKDTREHKLSHRMSVIRCKMPDHTEKSALMSPVVLQLCEGHFVCAVQKSFPQFYRIYSLSNITFLYMMPLPENQRDAGLSASLWKNFICPSFEKSGPSHRKFSFPPAPQKFRLCRPLGHHRNFLPQVSGVLSCR